VKGPRYEGLSYTWGSTENPMEAHANGELITIRRNLWDALQHLRSPHEQRVLGSTQFVSINTILLSENHQVGQMRTIYSRAETVIVWLVLETER